MTTTVSVPWAQLAEKMKADVATVVQRATFDLFRAVALRSPVDTGRFRANWNVSYGSPDLTTSTSVNQSRADSEAAKALELPVGGVVLMCNSLPYATRLEHGWSKQAPSGMVKISAVEFTTYVQKAIAK